MMKKVLTLVGLAGCLAAIASASTFYATSATQLYTVTVNGTNPSDVADGATYGAGVSMQDIAWFGGNLYGVGTVAGGSQLYSINVNTGVATALGASYSQAFDELTFNSSGVLYAAGNGTDLYTLILTGGTANAATTGTLAGTGDLEFIGSTLYTISGGTSNLLETVNLSTGALTPVGTAGTGAIGTANVLGLADPGGTQLYGVTNTGVVLTIATSGPGNLGVALTPTLTPVFTGATDTTFTPEPASFGFIGLGLVVLGGFAYRRRKA